MTTLDVSTPDRAPGAVTLCLACGADQLSLWCVARDEEYQTGSDPYTYWLCPKCACLSIDPCPREQLAKIYPPNYYSFTGQLPSLLERIKLALDRRLLRSILPTLEGAAGRAGCWRGHGLDA